MYNALYTRRKILTRLINNNIVWGTLCVRLRFSNGRTWYVSVNSISFDYNIEGYMVFTEPMEYIIYMKISIFYKCTVFGYYKRFHIQSINLRCTHTHSTSVLYNCEFRCDRLKVYADQWWLCNVFFFRHTCHGFKKLVVFDR